MFIFDRNFLIGFKIFDYAMRFQGYNRILRISPALQDALYSDNEPVINSATGEIERSILVPVLVMYVCDVYAD